MRLRPLISVLPLLFLGACSSTPSPFEPPADVAQLRTVAVRVANLEAMVAFYTEAFGARFREVDARGIRSQFADMAGMTLKFVPLRESADFVEYPSHQLGFAVQDVEAVVEIAERFGGRAEGPVLREGGAVHGAVRDPDGNTIELYATE